MAYSTSNSKRASVRDNYSRRSSGADAGESNVTSVESTRPGYKMYRVLLAHDLNRYSEIAFIRAARLTLERGGHLTILHVIDSDLPAPAIEARRAHAKGYLESEVVRWFGYNVSYRIDIGVGDPASAIAARARAHNVNLVVTGRHQQRAFPRIFIAGTVERLLRQIDRPILIVRNVNQSPYRRVFIPIDGKEGSAASIQFAAAFLPRARLHLLHAYKRSFYEYIASLSLTFSRQESGRFSDPIGQQSKTAVSQLIDALGMREREPLETIEKGDALALIKDELARQKTDLLVVGTHGREAAAALTSSRCDILVLPVHGLPDRLPSDLCNSIRDRAEQPPRG